MSKGEIHIPVSAEHREGAGIAAGQVITVNVERDQEPRTVEVPNDLAAALAAQPGATEAFNALSYTLRKEHVRQVESAKAEATRERRIAAILAELCQGVVGNTRTGAFVPQTTDETRRVVLQFWAAMQANDWAGAAALFADDYVLDWPQSGERIRGAANFIAINANYPAAGRWRFTVERLVAEGEVAVTDVLVTDGAVTARALTFTTVRSGQIVQQVEYWPDPYEAPPWRAAWVGREPVTGEP